MIGYKRSLAVPVACLALFLAAASAAAQGTAIPKSLDGGRAVAVLSASCAACHDWAGAYDTLLDPAAIVPGDSGASPAWLAIAEGRMPPDAPLSDADKTIIKDWIDSGARRPSGQASADAAPPASARFLGFKSKESFHRFSGWASGGLLLAAGVVGAVHALDMMDTAHAYRDTLAEDSLNDGNSPLCKAEIDSVWGASGAQALRWTHVGLLAAGESFYLANALTGASFMGRLGPGWSKAKIHRYAFFAHAGLMAAEGVMGYFSSDALSRGDHETFRALLTAHAVVGITIPVVILGAGAIMDPRIKL